MAEINNRLSPSPQAYQLNPGEIPVDVLVIEFTVAGNKLRRRCEGYLREQGLTVDPHGRAGGYDLVVMSSDLTVRTNRSA